MPVLLACLAFCPPRCRSPLSSRPLGNYISVAAIFPPGLCVGKPTFPQVLDQALHMCREQRSEIERDGFDVTQGE